MRYFASVLLWMFAFALSTMGQDNLPWLPNRDTNHIRTLRTYLIDSSTGKRRLIKQEEFDQHGYETCPNITLTYDELGRLTRRVELTKVTSVSTGEVRMDTVEVYDIQYSPDGKVNTCTLVQAQGEYATIITYRLVPTEKNPCCIEQTYYHTRNFTRHTEVYSDTVRWRRCYDEEGRIVSEETDDYYLEDLDYCNVYYTYDRLGRKATCRRDYYEYSESLSYHYDLEGNLYGMTGKGWDATMECDIVVRFRPNGTQAESWNHWRDVLEPDVADENVHRRYDERGVMIYYKDNRLQYECEVEYWE